MREADADLKQKNLSVQAGVSFAVQKDRMDMPCGVSRMIRMSTSLLLACLVLAVPARAEEECSVPMSEWQPRDAVAALAERNGWRVARIRLDDGCYEVIGEDAEGRPIEVKLDPATLKILDMEFEDHGGHGAGDDD